MQYMLIWAADEANKASILIDWLISMQGHTHHQLALQGAGRRSPEPVRASF